MQNNKKFTDIHRDISHSLMKKLKKKNVFQNPCNSTHKLMTMPNETIDKLTEELSVLNYRKG